MGSVHVFQKTCAPGYSIALIGSMTGLNHLISLFCQLVHSFRHLRELGKIPQNRYLRIFNGI